MPYKKEKLKPIQVTSGSKQHFFGYYDKEQWDSSNRYLLTHEVDFKDRAPAPEDEITIGMIDTREDFKYIPVSKTRAWCWQQGSMLQWIPQRDNLIIHNDRIGDRFAARIINVATGKVEKVLPRPIYTLSNDGKKALSLNFSRNAATRPGYGYYGLNDFRKDSLYPADDGIYLMDLETGKHELIISLEEMVNIRGKEINKNSKHWFNHLLFNPDDSRFIFLHRWLTPNGESFNTRLCTADLEGEDIFISDLKKGSHFIWYDKNTILIWGYTEKEGYSYYLITDHTDKKETVGKEVLTRDGHCTLTSDQEWMLTDEYPGNENKRKLILYKFRDNLRIDIGEFYSPPEYTGELRCDLHPRWDREDNQVCIDSLHEGERQMYILKVKKIINS